MDARDLVYAPIPEAERFGFPECKFQDDFSTRIYRPNATRFGIGLSMVTVKPTGFVNVPVTHMTSSVTYLFLDKSGVSEQSGSYGGSQTTHRRA